MKNNQKGFILPLLIIFIALVIGGAYLYVSKLQPNNEDQNNIELIPPLSGQDISNTDITIATTSKNTSITDVLSKKNLNQKISWVQNPPKLLSTIKRTNRERTNSSASCVAGSNCQDTYGILSNTDKIYSCYLDQQCSFFNGYTGIKASTSATTNVAPRNSTNSRSNYNQSLPPSVSGSSGCFNREALFQMANNPQNLTEILSNRCECGITPPSICKEARPGEIDENTGVINPGTERTVTNEGTNDLSCQAPGIYPDIIIENINYPKSTFINTVFNISLDFRNIGAKACEENYFQVDVNRTTPQGEENFGGVGAHIYYNVPIKPGGTGTFNFGSQILPSFDAEGDYKLNISLSCELPKETHIVNNLKEIHIQAINNKKF